MKLTFRATHNTIAPDLRAKIARAKNPAKALEAMGLTVVSHAQRAFTIETLRPAAWPALKSATVAAKRRAGYGTKPLRSTGALAQSPRVVSVNSKTVTVGSDRRAGSHSLAAIHQLGTKDGTIPARPFFPFDKSGQPTPRAAKAITSAAKAALKLETR